ncbi:ATP-binding protein [Nonomuraea sp. NPDC004297]
MTHDVQSLVPRQRNSRTVLAIPSTLVDAMINLHPGGLVWRRVYPGTLDQIPNARHFAGLLLADSPCREDAELIITELAANAVLHTSSSRRNGTFIVELTRTSREIGLAVYDCGWGCRPLSRRLCKPDAEHGRGLIVVEALADAMGYEGNDETGHKVWAVLFTST